MENAKTPPEDASLHDVRQKIQQGLDDAEAGRVVSHAEVQKRLAKWLAKQSRRNPQFRA